MAFPREAHMTRAKPLKITPDQIVSKYWRYPWVFKADGSLHIHMPGRTVVFQEDEYVPKAHRGKPT